MPPKNPNSDQGNIIGNIWEIRWELCENYMGIIWKLHWKYMENILGNIRNIQEYIFIYLNTYLFIKYISSILYKYVIYETDVVIFEKENYFNEVYIHNIDIWGFLSCFAYYNANTKSSIYKKEIKQLLKKYLFNEKYAIKKIPISELLSKFISTVIKI